MITVFTLAIPRNPNTEETKPSWWHNRFIPGPVHLQCKQCIPPSQSTSALPLSRFIPLRLITVNRLYINYYILFVIFALETRIVWNNKIATVLKNKKNNSSLFQSHLFLQHSKSAFLYKGVVIKYRGRWLIIKQYCN